MHKAQNVALLRADPKGQLYRCALCVRQVRRVGQLELVMRCSSIACRTALANCAPAAVIVVVLSRVEFGNNSKRQPLLLLLLFCILDTAECVGGCGRGVALVYLADSSMGLSVEQRLAHSLTLILCSRCCHC